MNARFIVMIQAALLVGCGAPATVGTPVDDSRTATVRTVVRGVEQASPHRWCVFIDRVDGTEVDYPGWDLRRTSLARRWTGHPVRFPSGMHSITGFFGTTAGPTGPFPKCLTVPFHGSFSARPGHTYEVVVTIAIGQCREGLQWLRALPVSAGVQVKDATDPSVPPVSLSIVDVVD